MDKSVLDVGVVGETSFDCKGMEFHAFGEVGKRGAGSDGEGEGEFVWRWRTLGDEEVVEAEGFDRRAIGDVSADHQVPVKGVGGCDGGNEDGGGEVKAAMGRVEAEESGDDGGVVGEAMAEDVGVGLLKLGQCPGLTEETEGDGWARSGGR